MEYDNTNRGVLFRNNRKEKDTHPDFTGSINIEGEDRWLDAWVRESKDGKKFFSISSRAKQGDPSSSGARPRQAETIESSEDIPF
jgi:uncharacterized protein (DUF736 family)